MHCLDARFSWWDDPQTAVGKGRAYIERALELDPDNADAYLAAGGLFWFERRFDDAVAHARRAVQLAPGSADVANLASFYLTSAGFPKKRSGKARRRLPSTHTTPLITWAISVTLIALPGKSRNRFLHSRLMTFEIRVPASALPILSSSISRTVSRKRRSGRPSVF